MLKLKLKSAHQTCVIVLFALKMFVKSEHKC